jgi:hypothetical protein
MAKVLGNISAQDDFMHPLGTEENFNESMYFNFFDPQLQAGGFVRLGNRANEGRAEMTTTLYLPDGRVLFMFKRAEISHNDAFDAGGMRFEVLEPAEKLRTVYNGSVVVLKEPRDMADPKKAFSSNPVQKVKLDLEHTAVGPMYGSKQDDTESDRPAEKQFGKAHYEQHMGVRGTIELGDETIEINGLGLRDHSWGPRYWQAIQSYEWLTMNFGENAGAMVSVIQRDEKNTRRGGVLVRDGKMEGLVDCHVDVVYEDGSPFHRSLDVRAKTGGGEDFLVHGEVKSFIPLRNRRGGQTTYIGEGMTEWTWGSQTGYGLSELLRTGD